jgi:hypothetical protein
MYKRCEKAKGKGNCEKWGAVVYPKCKSGYDNVACCICRPTPSSAQTMVSKTVSSSTFPVERTSLLVIPNPWIAQRVSKSRQASATSSAGTVIMELALFAGIKFQMDG